MKFLSSTLFRVFGIPLIGVLAAIVAKFVMREKNDPEPVWAMFAVGVDLMIASCIAVPATIAERAVAISHLGITKGNTVVTAQINSEASKIAVSGYLLAMLFFLMMVGLTYERRWGRPNRDKRTTAGRALALGVLVPALFGTSSLAIVFGLSR